MRWTRRWTCTWGRLVSENMMSGGKRSLRTGKKSILDIQPHERNAMRSSVGGWSQGRRQAAAVREDEERRKKEQKRERRKASRLSKNYRVTREQKKRVFGTTIDLTLEDDDKEATPPPPPPPPVDVISSASENSDSDFQDDPKRKTPAASERKPKVGVDAKRKAKVEGNRDATPKKRTIPSKLRVDSPPKRRKVADKEGTTKCEVVNLVSPARPEALASPPTPPAAASTKASPARKGSTSSPAGKGSTSSPAPKGLTAVQSAIRFNTKSPSSARKKAPALTLVSPSQASDPLPKDRMTPRPGSRLSRSKSASKTAAAPRADESHCRTTKVTDAETIDVDDDDASSQRTEHEGKQLIKSVVSMQEVPLRNYEPGGALRAGDVRASPKMSQMQVRKKKGLAAKKSDAVDPKQGRISTASSAPVKKVLPTLTGKVKNRFVTNGRKSARASAADAREHTADKELFGEDADPKQTPNGGLRVQAPSRKKSTSSVCKIEDEIEAPPDKFDAAVEASADVPDEYENDYEIDELGERVKKLTVEETERAKALGSKKSKLQIKVKCANIVLRTDDFRTLRGHRWLNDEIINSFAALLNERNRDFFGDRSKLDAAPAKLPGSHDTNTSALFKRPRPRTHMFNSFFMTRLTSGAEGYDYAGVRRWPRRAKVNIAQCDLVLVPVNLDNVHWVLVAVDLRAREFIYCDSMGGTDFNDTLRAMRRWLVDEVTDKADEETAAKLRVGEWRDVVNPAYLPAQRDQGSCGVFTLYNADFLELGRRPAFVQRNIATLRKRTALFLERNRLADHPPKAEADA